MNPDDQTDQEISDDNIEDAGDSTFWSDIEKDYLDHQQELLHLGQASQDKSLLTTRFPLH
jgi:hypothetical protein